MERLHNLPTNAGEYVVDWYHSIRFVNARVLFFRAPRSEFGSPLKNLPVPLENYELNNLSVLLSERKWMSFYISKDQPVWWWEHAQSHGMQEMEVANLRANG
jgi:hypothetical protein